MSFPRAVLVGAMNPVRGFFGPDAGAAYAAADRTLWVHSGRCATGSSHRRSGRRTVRSVLRATTNRRAPSERGGRARERQRVGSPDRRLPTQRWGRDHGGALSSRRRRRSDERGHRALSRPRAVTTACARSPDGCRSLGADDITDAYVAESLQFRMRT
jgi:hypothetical protein